MTGNVVIPDRLLEPVKVEVTGGSAKSDACWQVPFAIAVHGDANARADLPANRFETGDVVDWIVVADLDLDAREAFVLCRAARAGQECLEVERQPADLVLYASSLSVRAPPR